MMQGGQCTPASIKQKRIRAPCREKRLKPLEKWQWALGQPMVMSVALHLKLQWMRLTA